MPSFHVANICTAFNSKTIGTKVLNPDGFKAALSQSMEDYDMPANGHGFIGLPEALDFVSAGIGLLKPTLLESDFVVRQHRGKWGAYLKRNLAADAAALNVVVYTRRAYTLDPDVDANEIAKMGEATHVIVAVLASVTPDSPLAPNTLIHNIGGGNTEFQPQTVHGSNMDFIQRLANAEKTMEGIKGFAHDLALLHTIINKAQETEQYWSRWSVVAD